MSSTPKKSGDGQNLRPFYSQHSPAEMKQAGKAAVMREGKDATIVGSAIMVHKSLEAAEILAGEGISIEVIDLRSIPHFYPSSSCDLTQLLAIRKRAFTVSAEEPALMVA